MPLTTDQIIQRVFLLSLPLSIFIYLQMYVPNSDLIDPYKNFIAQDFMKIWTAGRLALDGRQAEIYDLKAYFDVVQNWFAPHELFANMSYPPMMLVVIAPLAALPFWFTAPIWVIGNLAAFCWAAVGNLRGRANWRLIGVLVLSPVMFINFGLAQNGGFTALLFMAGFWLIPKRPLLAGVMFGLLTVKPQVGLLIPLALIIIGAWRTFAAAAVVTVALVVISLVAFGVEPWQGFLTDTLKVQAFYLRSPEGQVSWLSHTPYMSAMLLGFSVMASYLLHFACALVVSVIALWHFAGTSSANLRIAILAIAAATASPYGLCYDLALPIAGVVCYLLHEHERLGSDLRIMLSALFLLPTVIILLQAGGVPFGFFVLAGTLWVLHKEAAQYQLSPSQAYVASVLKLNLIGGRRTAA